MQKHHKKHVLFFGGGTGIGAIVGVGTTFNVLLSQASEACTELIDKLIPFLS